MRARARQELIEIGGGFNDVDDIDSILGVSTKEFTRAEK